MMTSQAIRELLDAGMDPASARRIIAKSITLKRMEKEQAEEELKRLASIAVELDRKLEREAA